MNKQYAVDGKFVDQKTYEAAKEKAIKALETDTEADAEKTSKATTTKGSTKEAS